MKRKDETAEAHIAGMISINIGKGAADNNIFSKFDAKSTLVLPTRNLVLFPGVALPIQLGREISIKVVDYAKKTSCPIAVVCQKDPEIENPTITDLYDVGTLSRIIDIIELPNGIKTAIVEGIERVKIVGPSVAPTPVGAIAVSLQRLKEKRGDMPEPEFKTLLDKIRELADKLAKNPYDETMNPLQLPHIDGNAEPMELLNSLAVHIPLEVSEKQEILKADSLSLRGRLLLDALILRDEKMELMKEVMDKTRSRMEEGQRNAFLQQQLDVLRQELDGDDAEDIEELEARALSTALPEDVKTRFDKEIRKLRRYNPQSPDYAVQYTYLDTLLSLPWQDMSMPNDSFKSAEAILEGDHYGLRKIKDRILEQIALVMNNPEGQAPIICFVGPPGVGKTSLGQSIANALGREFQRVSLGGLHDEAEIRGHRRTYIGAMPGRIIEAMRRAGTINPVIMLDELDKIGADYKGDPAAALLEVLDPAQNYRFHDNYIDVDYDLSSVMFIATANTLATVSKPLLDRIEVIELSGYTVEEKIEIATRHIIPRLRQKNLIDENIFNINKKALKSLIENYTSESGVRQLEKLLESLMRKKLLRRTRSHNGFVPTVEETDLSLLLGPAPYHRDRYEGNDIPGVVTGLAWTSVGGEILLVEAALAPGKGSLVLTGNLGDVMKESATLALEWVKVNASRLNIDISVFKENDIHVHFPEGAIPKDGPSAGITIATAIVSALKQCRVKPRIAMTGEITLRGKVLPVGGIKEKMLAARRAGIKTIFLSDDNRKDVEDIEKKYLRGLDFHYVGTVAEVIEHALMQ